MTLFLRDSKNRNIVDMDLFTCSETNRDGSRSVDLRVGIGIVPYSILLLENQDKKEEIIKDFDFIDEMRGWLWEWRRNNTEENFKQIKDEVKDILVKIGGKYKLWYVED